MNEPIWVLVELTEGHDYGEEGLVTYKTLGNEVYGPFASKEEAEAYGKEINEARGWYTWHGRQYRCDRRDFDAFELVRPEVDATGILDRVTP